MRQVEETIPSGCHEVGTAAPPCVCLEAGKPTAGTADESFPAGPVGKAPPLRPAEKAAPRPVERAPPPRVGLESEMPTAGTAEEAFPARQTGKAPPAPSQEAPPWRPAEAPIRDKTPPTPPRRYAEFFGGPLIIPRSSPRETGSRRKSLTA